MIRSKSRQRAGTATVELALTMPLLFLFAFGSAEACTAIHLQQSVTEAAYSGALAGIPTGATKQEVENRMQDILSSRRIDGAVFTVEGTNGTDFDQLVPGDTFRVTVNVPAKTSGGSLYFLGLSDFEISRVAFKQ